MNIKGRNHTTWDHHTRYNPLPTITYRDNFFLNYNTPTPKKHGTPNHPRIDNLPVTVGFQHVTLK